MLEEDNAKSTDLLLYMWTELESLEVCLPEPSDMRCRIHRHPVYLSICVSPPV